VYYNITEEMVRKMDWRSKKSWFMKALV